LGRYRLGGDDVTGGVKRFKLQCGAVVKVSECDAYLLRSHVWRSHKTVAGRFKVITGRTNEHKTLSRAIVGNDHEVVAHLNGDDFDFTRGNLAGMTREEFYAMNAPKQSAGMHRWWGEKRKKSSTEAA
jgi:hypothetical protein